MGWKDFFYYQRGERVAVILLLILIVLILLLNVLLERNNERVVLTKNDAIVLEFEQFQRSLKEQEMVVPPDKSVETEPHFHRREKSSKESSSASEKHSIYAEVDSSLTPAYIRTDKLAEGETIFLNESDTSEWKKIPGIGSTYASRIVKYRNLLGGFASVDQLREVYGIDNELFFKISSYIKADGDYTKIAINQLEFRELLRHPYLNYKQVKAIIDLRKRKGRISSLNELAMLDEFTAEDLERLKPYLAF